MSERWKPIPSEPGYEVSDLGRVRSCLRVKLAAASKYRPAHNRTYQTKLLKPGKAKSGHLTVACGKGNSRYVHDLVLEAFVSPRPDGLVCLHKGDIHEDNRLSSLRWGTYSENLKEAWANGRRA